MKTTKPSPKSGWTWQRALPYVLLVGGCIGLIASLVLTYDKFQVLQNPGYEPGCNLNPVLSCGSVMKAAQAELFGIPNSIFGLMAFSGLAMFGLAMLAGATFSRWFWQAVQIAATVGVFFMHYLFFQAVFRIHAICPWCFAVWMITIPIFLGITVYNIRADNLGLSRFAATKRLATLISKRSGDILILWYVLILGILLVKFWYFWSTFL